jgi:hypothetical protein
LACALGLAASAAEDDGFTPLFNGRDLSGWVPVNVAPNTFTVRDGLIVSTGVPTGVMRTARHYQNFILEVEWRHLRKGGNAGLFVYSEPLTAPGVPFTKSIEVQILDGNSPEGIWTGHGDVFSIHGAKMVPDRPHPRGWERCLPTELRAKPAGEWNHYRVESRDGRLTLAVNGKVVSGASQCRPRKGYICLESEGSECHFRNLRIKELPSSNPPDEEVASLDQGFKSLYSGLDLTGWRAEPGHTGHWKANDWILAYDGRSEAPDKHLWTEREFRDFSLIVDWRLTRPPEPKQLPVILPSGDYALNDDGTRKTTEVQDAGDSGILLRGDPRAEVNIWCWPVGSGELWKFRDDQTLPAEVRAAATPKARADKPPGQWNRFVITLRGERLTVELNGQTLIENARLPGIPARGPIGLQHHGDPIQFANLYVKELE